MGHALTSYRLDEIAKLAAELGLESHRVEGNRLNVVLHSDIVLEFCNLLEESCFETGGGTYVECDELEILVGLGSGELVVVSQYRNGELVDRWLAHKSEPLELSHIQGGEELRVYRLST